MCPGKGVSCARQWHPKAGDLPPGLWALASGKLGVCSSLAATLESKCAFVAVQHL